MTEGANIREIQFYSAENEKIPGLLPDTVTISQLSKILTFTFAPNLK